MSLVNLAHLKTVLRYDPITGTWTRLKGAKRGQARAGDRVDRNHDAKYLKVSFCGKRYLPHRLAFFYMTGRWPIGVDHFDRNGKNNKWNNLREVTSSQNHANAKLFKNNKSGYRGVWWNAASGKWCSSIAKDRKVIYIGSFKKLDEAVAAYTRHAKKLFGSFYNAP